MQITATKESISFYPHALSEVQEQLCLKPPPSSNITFSDIILHKLPTVLPA
jgi:hypothetical protein